MSVGASQFRGYALVLAAAALWATLGLFYKGRMVNYGLAPLAIIFWRIAVASACVWAGLGVWRREARR